MIYVRKSKSNNICTSANEHKLPCSCSYMNFNRNYFELEHFLSVRSRRIQRQNVYSVRLLVSLGRRCSVLSLLNTQPLPIRSTVLLSPHQGRPVDETIINNSFFKVYQKNITQIKHTNLGSLLENQCFF